LALAKRFRAPDDGGDEEKEIFAMRNMRKTVGWLVTLVVCLGLAVPDLAAQGKGGNKGKKGGESEGGGTISVCVTFRDQDSPGIDLIRSDGTPEYCDGSEGVLAIVGVKNGGFRLDTNNKGREVSLDFSDCVDGEVCTSSPPSGSEDVDLRLGEEFDCDMGGCLPMGNKLDIFEMDGEETAFGALVIKFAPTGRANKLLFKVVFGQVQFSVCEGGDPVTVTRGGDPGEPTNSWKISATDTDEACLFKVVDNNAEGTLEGRFHLPFSIDVVEQP
jgi:hypothetical protein